MGASNNLSGEADAWRNEAEDNDKYELLTESFTKHLPHNSDGLN